MTHAFAILGSDGLSIAVCDGNGAAEDRIYLIVVYLAFPGVFESRRRFKGAREAAILKTFLAA